MSSDYDSRGLLIALIVGVPSLSALTPRGGNCVIKLQLLKVFWTTILARAGKTDQSMHPIRCRRGRTQGDIPEGGLRSAAQTSYPFEQVVSAHMPGIADFPAAAVWPEHALPLPR